MRNILFGIGFCILGVGLYFWVSQYTPYAPETILERYKENPDAFVFSKPYYVAMATFSGVLLLWGLFLLIKGLRQKKA